MCRRFGLITSPEEVANAFDLTELAPFPPRHNVAPSQPVLMVVNASDLTGGGNGRNAILVRWGLIPAWVKDAKDFSLLFNARSETAQQKPSFRGAMRHFRTLVPASGFYEWRKEGGGEAAQPYWITPRHGGVIAFAGLLSPWMGRDGTELDTGAILTTDSSGLLADIHERAPVVIAPQDYSRWLDCSAQEPRHVLDLLKPAPDDFFNVVPVSDAVNNIRNMSAELVKPIAPLLESVEVPESENDQMDLFRRDL